MDATANRGIGIDNVEVGTGDMSFHSAVLTGEVNHGHRVSDWTVNLGLGLNYQNSSRDAYTETGIDFPIAFKDLDVETLYATAVVGASHGLGTALDYGVNAGVNFDLFSDEIAMKGTSEIPEFDNFNIDMTGNRLNTRPFVEAEVNWSMGDGYRLSLNTRAAAPVYGSGIDVHTALSCTFSF
jgi:hypothetical protein